MCFVRPTRFKKKKQKNSDWLPTFKNQEIPHKNPDFRLHFKNLKIWQHWVHTPLEQLARAEPRCPFRWSARTPWATVPTALATDLHRQRSSCRHLNLLSQVCHLPVGVSSQSCSERQTILQHLKAGSTGQWKSLRLVVSGGGRVP